MGWTFRCDPSFGRKQLIEDLRRPSRFSEGTQLLQACAKGNNHWYLAKTGDKIWIGLDLMQGGGRNQGWGYKDMDESCGPNEVDCPISYLDKASEPRGYAEAWRQRVREYHTTQAAKPKLAEGLVLKYGQHEYKLRYRCNGRKGWAVNRLDDGVAYRLTFRQINAALSRAQEVTA